MKSELGLPARCGISFGTAVSVAIWWAIGSTAAGRRFPSAAVVPRAPPLAALADAPATATPARNLRRLTSGREPFRAISNLPQRHSGPGQTGPMTSLEFDLIAPAWEGSGQRTDVAAAAFHGLFGLIFQHG